jgi:hypothetical protein
MKVSHERWLKRLELATTIDEVRSVAIEVVEDDTGGTDELTVSLAWALLVATEEETHW